MTCNGYLFDIYVLSRVAHFTPMFSVLVLTKKKEVYLFFSLKYWRRITSNIVQLVNTIVVIIVWVSLAVMWPYRIYTRTVGQWKMAWVLEITTLMQIVRISHYDCCFRQVYSNNIITFTNCANISLPNPPRLGRSPLESWWPICLTFFLRMNINAV